MGKDLTITVNGEPCEISYTVIGRKYEVTIKTESIIKEFGSVFSFSEIEGKAMWLITSKKSEVIGGQIAKYIIEDTKSNKA